MQLSEIHKGLLCMVNPHQNENWSKREQNSTKFSELCPFNFFLVFSNITFRNFGAESILWVPTQKLVPEFWHGKFKFDIDLILSRTTKLSLEYKPRYQHSTI